jgi:hypothetical protein
VRLAGGGDGRRTRERVARGVDEELLLVGEREVHCEDRPFGSTAALVEA